MVVTQSAVTLIAEILAGHERAVQTLLEAAGQDAAHNDLVSFSVFPSVHFARFFVIDASQDLQGRPLAPRLVFLADVDGSADEFLSELTQRAAGGLAALYEHCRDFPGKAALRTFVQSCSVPTAALYVNTRGRTVAQVHQEAALREAIQGYLDRTQDEWRDASPRRVRAAIQEFVEREAALAWARRPLQGPDISYVLGEKLQVLLVGIAGIVLFPLILLGLPLYAVLLRLHETWDVARDVVPDDARIQALAAQEDHGTQNPFTSAGLLKPGPFRRFTATVVLWGTNFLARHVFNHADLIGVKTIHFARWLSSWYMRLRARP